VRTRRKQKETFSKRLKKYGTILGERRADSNTRKEEIEGYTIVKQKVGNNT